MTREGPTPTQTADCGEVTTQHAVSLHGSEPQLPLPPLELESLVQSLLLLI